MLKVTVSKTFAIITPESAADGDFHETGFEYEDKEITAETAAELVQELADLIRDELGCVEFSSSAKRLDNGDWVESSDPERDYQDGSETYYSLHFQGLTEELNQQLLQAIG